MMTKRILYGLLLVSLFATSCKEFLETKPQDTVLPDDYFKNEDEVYAYLSGIYDRLGKSGTYGRYLYFEMDMSDEGFNSVSSQVSDLSLYNYDPSDIKLTSTWLTLYQGVDRANLLLQKIDSARMDSTSREVARGEALFLRGYFYFILTSNFGEVPLRLKATDDVGQSNFPKSPLSAIYSQILSDMTEAEKRVKPVSAYPHSGRVTKSAVWGLLARVNLKMAGAPVYDRSRFAEARKWALKAIDSKFHQLIRDYKEVFINMCQDKYDTRESIWEVEFAKASSGQYEEGSLGSITGIGTSNEAIGYSYGIVKVMKSYYDSFSAEDLRRDWTINDYYYATNGTKTPYAGTSNASIIYNRCNAKWRREYETATPKYTSSTSINFPLLRYSDILLMFAEAENEVNGPTQAAYDAINAVRERAYGVLLETDAVKQHALKIKADLPSGLDADDFRSAIQKERSLELGFEGLRRFDLVRWGIYYDVMKSTAALINATAPEYWRLAARSGNNLARRDTLFAIPSRELSLNREMTQNKGW
ncbi:RagB/SusD family nutrient uptake outer membrane protein [Arcticibacter sp. MXS-1]|uniref:RagB/SusD family nutrient uptake outer membrane protein n=1 Tax=Arcticibacter sp. MXS-1 TaxID=3341726 RepID=UPI0035A915BE